MEGKGVYPNELCYKTLFCWTEIGTLFERFVKHLNETLQKDRKLEMLHFIWMRCINCWKCEYAESRLKNIVGKFFHTPIFLSLSSRPWEMQRYFNYEFVQSWLVHQCISWRQKIIQISVSFFKSFRFCTYFSCRRFIPTKTRTWKKDLIRNIGYVFVYSI